MTWIVGTAPPFGYSILVSDVCVTFRDAEGHCRTADCLQKIYQLGQFILGGFAGSVKIGLSILAILQQQFAQIPQNKAWQVDVVANTWLPRLVRQIFLSAPEAEQQIGSSIILASAHPTRNCGDAPWPWTDVHVFRYPDFKPEKAAPMEVIAIGSGAQAKPYMEAVRDFCSDSVFMQTITSGENAQALILAHTISRTVAESPTPGISTHFQVGLVTRGKITIRNFERTDYDPDGKKTSHKFPKIAHGWDEFTHLCTDLAQGYEEAMC